MHSFSFLRLSFFCTLFFGLASVSLAAPTPKPTPNMTTTMFSHSGLSNNNATVPLTQFSVIEDYTLRDTGDIIMSNPEVQPPYFVLYSDQATQGLKGPIPAELLQGYNVLVISVLTAEGPVDKAQEWAQLDTAQRTIVKAQYAAAGIKLLVSAFGPNDAPTSSGADPIATADTMADFVKEFDFDGIDVDYEDFNAMNAGDGSAEAWVINFTKQLRRQLSMGQYIVSHSPVVPYFAPGKFPYGGYLTVNEYVGGMIDWYNVQFYNQGTHEYTTCPGLLTNSSQVWPQTSLFEIASNGVDINKLVIGKPAKQGDASTGYMQPDQLAVCLAQAASQGWNGGVMGYQFPDADPNWIAMVRSQAFPE